MSTPSTSIDPAAQEFWLPGGQVGVLIIHGYGGSIADYRQFAGHLQAAGYSVLGLRLAGHGADHHYLAKFGPDDWRRSVKEAAEKLKAACRSIVLLGGSFGGDLAVDYIVRYPSRVAGLVTINTPILYRHRQLRTLWLRLIRFRSPYYRKPHRSQTPGSTTHWPIGGLFATADFIEMAVIPALPRITVPALIMTTADDQYVDTASATYLHQTLGSPRKSIVSIPTVLHNPFHDLPATALIQKKVEEFLQTLFAPPPE